MTREGKGASEWLDLANLRYKKARWTLKRPAPEDKKPAAAAKKKRAKKAASAVAVAPPPASPESLKGGPKQLPAFAPKTPELKLWAPAPQAGAAAMAPGKSESEEALACQRRLDFERMLLPQATSPSSPSPSESSEGSLASDRWRAVFRGCSGPEGDLTARSVLSAMLKDREWTSGIAYLRTSESRQVGAEHCERLPHIMYRKTGESLPVESPVKRRTKNCLKNASLFPAVACTMALQCEMKMRNYLLEPSGRRKVMAALMKERQQGGKACDLFECKSVHQLGKHMSENTCVILHYKYNSVSLLKACASEEEIGRSDVQIVVHVKRCLAMVSKEISRVAACLPGKDLRAPTSFGLRLDLFISPHLLATLSQEELASLLVVIRGFEGKIEGALKTWNVGLVVDHLHHLEKIVGTELQGAAPLAGGQEGAHHAGHGGAENECEGAGPSLGNAQSVALKALVQRVDSVARKVDGAMGIQIILSRIIDDDTLLKYINTKRDYFPKSALYMFSALLLLMHLVDRLSSLGAKGCKSIEPLHFIFRSNSRDAFTYELVEERTKCRKQGGGGEFVKTEFFFPPDQIPENYRQVVPTALYSDELKRYPAGLTTYTDLIGGEDLDTIESRVVELEQKIGDCLLPKACFHDSVKRTKTFFGARYLWTRQQLSVAESDRAEGIRVDVPPVPKWVGGLVEQPMVEAEVLPRDFVNSAAVNIYHDGSEGIQSHYDDASRFAQPIVSLRIFSDSRLSFGTRYFGYVNGSFFVPMPRGCVTVMEENGYGANGIKHSVRPTDMTHKSAAIILRHVHDKSMATGREILLQECQLWLDNLSLRERQDEGRAPNECLYASAMASERKTRLECEEVVRSLLDSVQVTGHTLRHSSHPALPPCSLAAFCGRRYFTRGWPREWAK